MDQSEEEKILQDAYADEVRQLFKNFFIGLGAAQDPGEEQASEERFLNGLRLARRAHARARKLAEEAAKG
jgi:hypothetical protein